MITMCCKTYPPSCLIGSGCLLFIFLIIAGCAANNTGLKGSPDSLRTACWQFYQDLDRIVFAHDAEDTGEMRVSGFPYLRSNRFWASFDGPSLSEAAYAQWLEQLRHTDAQARILEFANLPAGEAAKIKSRLPAHTAFQQRLQACGRVLIESMLSNKLQDKAELSAAAAVPDDYQTWKRIAGAYPLLRFAADIGIDDLHRELNKPFQLPIEQIPVAGRLIRYQPNHLTMLVKQEISEMLEAAYQNPLHIPLLKSEQLERLFGHFAPVWEIDTRNPTDLIGAVTFDTDGQPMIDTGKPTVYVKQAYTRFHDENLLQLIYQIWLPAREKTGLFDLYGGELDSVIWRVTLNRQGLPIAYDSIHACGCYYLLFPAKGYRALSGAEDAEPVLAPKQITLDPYQERLLLRLAARTHYLQQISELTASTKTTPYRLRAYDHLRKLEFADGQRRSLFGAEGIIEASQRNERFLLWPFGVASPGAMRQWGGHAIAFVGRRHFDDPDLLEKLIVPLNYKTQ